MSFNTSRTGSHQPSYMKPTIASDARSRGSSPIPSSPSKAPSSPRTTAASPKPIQRTAKGAPKPKTVSARTGPVKHGKLSSSKSATARSSETLLASPDLKRAAQEDRIGAEMSRIALSKGLIDGETARNWATPWHVKGELSQTYSDEIRAKYIAENGVVPEEEEMMGLEEALRIKAKNDEELEEWCAAYKAGFIDDDGFVVSTGEELLPGEYTAVVKARERDAQREAAKKVASREASPKKDPLKKVQEGRVTKAAASKKASEFTIIDQTPAFLEPASAKAGPEKAEKAGKTNKAKAKGEPKPEAATAKPCSQTRKADDDFSVRSLPGLPHYQEYNYNQLVAICRERNIKSGGGAQKVRNRLIEDDILVTQDKFDERDVRNYSHEGRDHTTPAPFVQNAPVAKPAEMTPAMRKKQRSMKKNSPAPTTTEPSATVPATTKPEKSEKCAKTTKRARDDDNEDEVVAQPKSKKVKAT